ncbi:MAG: flagellar hook-basal body complex protein FliE [Syntrophales bacterium]
MTEMIIRGGDLMPPGFDNVKPPADKQTGGKDFSQVLNEAVQGINQLQQNADEAIASVQLDNTASVHEALIALEKADISFRAMMQVRNKILEAYQEVMRTQV